MRKPENLLLARLSREDRARLEPHLRAGPLPQGMVLCEADHEIEHIYFPNSGVVSSLTVLSDGSEVEASTMGHETAFGLLAAQEPSRSFTRDIVQMPGEGSSMPARQFRIECDQSRTLQKVARRHLRATIGFMSQSVACNARHRLEARLCRWLLTCDEYVEGHVLPLTQEFIGIMLGVHRATVNDAAALLQEDGLIEVVRGKVRLLDRDNLRRRSCECYAETRARIDAALGPPRPQPLDDASLASHS